MPKRGAFALGLTALGLALLLNFQVPTDPVTVGRQPGTGGTFSGGTSGATSGGRSSGGTPGGSGESGGTGAGPGSGGSTDATGQRTVDGPVVDTRWGPVQVSVTVNGSQLVDVAALELPSGGRSGQISSYAEPILRSQALQAQSANIDGVSGATYTSVAYARSLQAALDSAGI
jgi:hypothetical protein